LRFRRQPRPALACSDDDSAGDTGGKHEDAIEAGAADKVSPNFIRPISGPTAQSPSAASAFGRRLVVDLRNLGGDDSAPTGCATVHALHELSSGNSVRAGSNAGVPDPVP